MIGSTSVGIVTWHLYQLLLYALLYYHTPITCCNKNPIDSRLILVCIKNLCKHLLGICLPLIRMEFFYYKMFLAQTQRGLEFKFNKALNVDRRHHMLQMIIHVRQFSLLMMKPLKCLYILQNTVSTFNKYGFAYLYMSHWMWKSTLIQNKFDKHSLCL